MRRVLLETACGCRRTVMLAYPGRFVRVAMFKNRWEVYPGDEVPMSVPVLYRDFEWDGTVDDIEVFREVLR